MTARPRGSAVLAVAMLTSIVTAASAHAGCGKSIFEECDTNEHGASLVLLSRGQVIALPKYPGDEGGALVAARPPDAPVYKYVSLNDCAQAVPETITQDVSCTHALRDCPPNELGPLLRIWRQTLTNGQVTEPWRTAGLTCASDVAPGARPTLTMADIRAAFMRTPWSKPQISSQPAGNVTLVNLTTFYQVNWATAGFQPGEVDASVLRGIPVRIRPKLVGFTYTFGDGSSMGPTTSPGGIYPDGDITHIYADKGAFDVRVNTTFGADFSLDGTSWDAIPDQVTVPGPTTSITVREANSVLVNR